MKESRLVYIASPYAGDIQSNVEFAKAACRFAVSQGATPLAVHLLYPQILDDRIPDERTAGIQMGLRVLRACDELWVCGDFISHGMQAELDAAKNGASRSNRSERKNCLLKKYRIVLWRWSDDDNGKPV
ncbi:MAG: DUF4406 domain-containing protein [Pilosibacter sp.]